MMLFIVSSPNDDVEEIHLKYFEPGLTFTVSDGHIEKQMRKTRKSYDFRDIDHTIKCNKVLEKL